MVLFDFCSLCMFACMVGVSFEVSIPREEDLDVQSFEVHMPPVHPKQVYK